VSLLAAQGSAIAGDLYPYHPLSTELEVADIAHATVGEIKPDIVHDHTKYQVFRQRHPAARGLSTCYYEKYTRVPNFVYASRSNRDENGGQEFVYHGLEPGEYDFAAQKDEFFLFIGSVHPRKNPEDAILAAKRAGKKLKVAGPIAHPRYFCKRIRKKLNDDIEWIGEVRGFKKRHLLARAKGMIFPTTWESFGIVIIEAMVSGTPVISSSHPVCHELIEHGKTGFICGSVREIARAIDRVGEIAAEDCRRRVLDHFTADIQADRYLELYQRVLRGETWS
jgi:glycosyltransferase involved in cell wall biosynthesis